MDQHTQGPPAEGETEAQTKGRLFRALWLRRLITGLKFLGFGVLFALAPFAICFVQLHADGFSVVWSEIGPLAIGKGQLYLVCIGLSGAALGELLCCGQPQHVGRVLAGIGCAGFLLSSGWMYGGSLDCRESVQSYEGKILSQRTPSQPHHGLIPRQRRQNLVRRTAMVRRIMEETSNAKRQTIPYTFLSCAYWFACLP